MMTNGDISDEDTEEQFLNDPVIKEEEVDAISTSISTPLSSANHFLQAQPLLYYFLIIIILNGFLQLLFGIIFFVINPFALVFLIPSIVFLLGRGGVIFKLYIHFSVTQCRMISIITCTGSAFHALYAFALLFSSNNNTLSASFHPILFPSKINVLYIVFQILFEIMLFGISYFLCTSTQFIWNQQSIKIEPIALERKMFQILFALYLFSLLFSTVLFIQQNHPLYLLQMIILSLVHLFVLILVFISKEKIEFTLIALFSGTVLYSFLIFATFLCIVVGYAVFVDSSDRLWIAVASMIILQLMPATVALVFIYKLWRPMTNPLVIL